MCQLRDQPDKDDGRSKAEGGAPFESDLSGAQIVGRPKDDHAEHLAGTEDGIERDEQRSTCPPRGSPDIEMMNASETEGSDEHRVQNNDRGQGKAASGVVNHSAELDWRTKSEIMNNMASFPLLFDLG